MVTKSRGSKKLGFNLRKLINSKRRMRSLAEAFPDIVVNINSNGEVLFINQAKKGVDLRRIIGRTIYDLMSSKYHKKAKACVKKVFEKGATASYESRNLDSKNPRWYMNYVKALSSEGRIVAATIKSVDITDFKKSEQDLRKERDWSKMLIKSAPNIVVGLGDKSRILLFNDFAEKLTGYKASEVIGQRWIELFASKKMRRQLYGVWNRMVNNKLAQHYYVSSIITKKGDKRVISWSNTVITEEGKFKMVLSVGEDITEQKKAEQALKESEKRFKQLYEYAPIPYHSLTTNGLITNVNRKWCELLGYKKKEVIGKPIFNFIVKEERASARESFERKKKSKGLFVKGHQRDYLTKDGKVKTFIINDFISFSGRDIKAIHTTMQDITEHEVAEQALKESEERLKRIIDSASDAMIMINAEGRISLWNKAAVKMFNYSKEDAIGKKPMFFLSELLSKVGLKQERIQKQSVEQAPYEVLLSRKDGSCFPAEFTISLVKIEGKFHSLLIIRDVTEHNEMQRMKTELEREKELELVKNNFLMMITHELKQPISPILGFAELIRRNLRDDKLIDYLNAITSSAENMRGSVMKIHNLMKLEAGQVKLKFSRVNLSDPVNRALNNKSSAIKLRGVQIIKHLTPVFVKGNDELLEEVFNNLIDNAVKFSRKGGKLIVKSWSDKGRVFASVKDQGAGISEKDLPNVFNKFYQTEEGLRIGGFGIGLSICSEIIKAHKGEISVKSKQGKGSEFIVMLNKAEK